jgi:hypothetical protein
MVKQLLWVRRSSGYLEVTYVIGDGVEVISEAVEGRVLLHFNRNVGISRGKSGSKVKKKQHS